MFLRHVIIIVRSVTNAGLLLYVSHNMINNVIESLIVKVQ